MRKSHLLDAVCACVLTLTTITTQATLIGVLPATPGDTDWQAYYDDQLDITWAANANVNSDIKWDAAVAWTSNLTIGGVGGWRLPSVDVNNDGTVVDCTGGGVTGCFDNEYGYLYWEENVTGGHPTPFDNLGNHDWWSGTEWSSTGAWAFVFTDGSQAQGSKVTSRYAWAVNAGNVVPTTPVLWLIGIGLPGLVFMARKKTLVVCNDISA